MSNSFERGPVTYLKWVKSENKIYVLFEVIKYAEDTVQKDKVLLCKRKMALNGMLNIASFNDIYLKFICSYHGKCIPEKKRKLIDS